MDKRAGKTLNILVHRYRKNLQEPIYIYMTQIQGFFYFLLYFQRIFITQIIKTHFQWGQNISVLCVRDQHNLHD